MVAIKITVLYFKRWRHKVANKKSLKIPTGNQKQQIGEGHTV